MNESKCLQDIFHQRKAYSFEVCLPVLIKSVVTSVYKPTRCGIHLECIGQ